MKIRGIGFDLGETLPFYRDTPLNWSALYPDALRAVAQACAVSLTPEQIAQAGEILARFNTRIVPRTQEVSAEEIWPLILSAWGLDSARHLSAAMEAFFTFFQQNMVPYPETVRVLTLLRECAIPVGILTDVPYGMPRRFVQRDLDEAGLAGLFDVLLTSVEVGVRKPEPTGYLALAARLGLAPEEILLEDQKFAIVLSDQARAREEYCNGVCGPTKAVMLRQPRRNFSALETGSDYAII